MNQAKTRCLILACGNTLCSDDGLGPWIANWSEEHFGDDPGVRVISCQQWTPDLAEDIANADSVLFLDCSVESAPGQIKLTPVESAAHGPGLATHHTGAAELLALTQELYGAAPRTCLLLTIGGGSIELGESFSPAVLAALPEACRLIEETVREPLR